MNTLADRIAQIIRADGPMTIASYMQHCLLDPSDGYYSTREPFGASGDFVTAPDISQMFGELLGLAIAQAWLDRGAPAPFNLVELGPGRGTLMADALRATAGVRGFREAARVHLIEASPRLRAIQADTLPASVKHHESLGSLPDAPTFVIANEFFDALPIRQYVRDGKGWRERVVGLVDDALRFGLTDVMVQPDLTARLDDTKDGDLIEISAAATNIARDLGEHLAKNGGVAFIIDYGDWRSLGDTLQAVKAHQSAPILKAPGTSDLTANVDFETLAQAAKPLAASRLTPQGVFLERLGITTRARALASSLDGTALDQHIAAHRRLTHADEMGTLFKVMALYQKDSPLPPGVTA